MVAAVRREGTSTTIGIATSARRCPNRPALVDEIGTLTYEQLDVRCDALAAALQALRGGAPETIGIMCRNHRGFVEALAATNRIGADVLLLNTSFAGPALAEVVAREGVDAVVYDEEFTSAVERAVADNPNAGESSGGPMIRTARTSPSKSLSPDISASGPRRRPGRAS